MVRFLLGARILFLVLPMMAIAGCPERGQPSPPPPPPTFIAYP